jgi:EthD domain
VPRGEFHRYRREHAAKVQSVAEAIYPNRGVQGHTLPTSLNEATAAKHGLIAPYEGITELWWATMTDFTGAITSEVGVF